MSLDSWLGARGHIVSRLALFPADQLDFSLPYLSPDRGKSRRSPSRSVESFFTVRGLGFPREFGFGVRRRGVVINSPGTVRISVGTPPFLLSFFWISQPGVWVS